MCGSAGAATKSVADALARGPLPHRKAHAFAKHPSGSRPRAPGVRFPSDVLVFDPCVPRPQGPGRPTPRPKKEPLRTPAARPRSRTRWAVTRVQSRRFPQGSKVSPRPRLDTSPGWPCKPTGRSEALGDPEPEEVGLLPGSLGEGGGPEGGKAAPTGAQGIRAFLGLGPSQVPPSTRQKVAKVSKAGKPARAKATRVPRRSASQESPGAKSQESPSGNPACHIHQWLQRTGVAAARATARAQGAPGSSNDPPPEARPADGGAGLDTRVVTGCTPGPPGSSNDPPPRGGPTP